jgi:hypothetical protein
MDFVAVLDQVVALLWQRGRLTYRTLKRQFPHSPGSSGRRSASEGEDHSHPDFPLIHDVQSSCQPQNNVNNIKALEFYHEIRWSLSFSTN